MKLYVYMFQADSGMFGISGVARFLAPMASNHHCCPQQK